MAAVRIDEETRRKIKRYGIPVSEVARTAILREIERREQAQALEALRRMREILAEVDVERIVGYIMEDRFRR